MKPISEQVKPGEFLGFEIQDASGVIVILGDLKRTGHDVRSLLSREGETR